MVTTAQHPMFEVLALGNFATSVSSPSEQLSPGANDGSKQPSISTRLGALLRCACWRSSLESDLQAVTGAASQARAAQAAASSGTAGCSSSVAALRDRGHGAGVCISTSTAIATATNASPQLEQPDIRRLLSSSLPACGRIEVDDTSSPAIQGKLRKDQVLEG